MSAEPSSTTSAIASARPPRSKRSASTASQSHSQPPAAVTLAASGCRLTIEVVPIAAPSDKRDRCSTFPLHVATHNQALGRLGEDAAARWYETNGYTVVDRNWRSAAGELDLVVVRFRRRHPDVVVFSEVKTRTSSRFGEGVLAVGWKKQQRIRRLGGEWLARQDVRFGEIRFDIVDVNARGQVVVYEAAF